MLAFNMSCAPLEILVKGNDFSCLGLKFGILRNVFKCLKFSEAKASY